MIAVGPAGDEVRGTLVAEYLEATVAEFGAPPFELPPEHFDAYLVVTRDGEVVGGDGFARYDQDAAELKRCWVRPAFRRGGVGRALVHALLDGARQLGYTRMVLDVIPARAAAIALYRELGFTDTLSTHDYAFRMVDLARDL